MRDYLKTVSKNITGECYSISPSVTSISPTSGPAIGATLVTLTGNYFTDSMQISLGGNSCSGVTKISTTSATCTTASHTAESVSLLITNDLGESATFPNIFTYNPAPTVTSASPNYGALAGNSAINITGTGFVSGATVKVGDVTCTSPSVTSATTLTCTTGAHAAGSVDIVVRNPDTQARTGTSVFNYQNAPTVTSINKTSGAVGGGDTIIITGTGFATGATVDVGGANCASLSVNSSTQITCTTTSHASLGEAWTSMTTSSAPSIRRNHTAVWTGTKMIVFGGFNGSSYLNTGGQYDPTANTWSSTTTSSAPSIRHYHTAIWTGTKMIAFGGYNGGTSITITGTGFLTNPTITVGGVDCTSPSYSNATTLTCTTGAHAAGTVDIIVTNNDAQAGTGTSVFTYQAALSVSSSSPSSGLLGGGYTITISGTNFSNGATVTVGGNACASVSVTNSTTITCVPQNHTAGAVDILVTNTDTQSGTGSGVFTYIDGETWTAMTTSGAPSIRGYHTAVWTGSKMLVFGGFGGLNLNTGGPITKTIWIKTYSRTN